ncbi:hypothetical protein D3C80_1487080 [compost metagenome]
MWVNRLQVATRQRPVWQQAHQFAAFQFLFTEHAGQRSEPQAGTYSSVTHYEIIDRQAWLQRYFLLFAMGAEQAEVYQPVCFGCAQYGQ